MPLRSPDLLGFGDPRQVSTPTPDAPPKPRPRTAAAKPAVAVAPPAERRAVKRAAAKRAPERRTQTGGEGQDTAPAPAPEPTAAVPVASATAVALGDEERFFLQAMAPRERRRRLEFACFELTPDLPRLATHQTIIAALLWRHVDHTDAESRRALGELLDAFAGDPLSQQHADTKVGANIPRSLKRRLDGAVLRLGDTVDRVSNRAVVNALIWRHVDADDPQRLAALADLLRAYDAAAHPARARPAAA